WALILGARYKKLCYVDCFAGPGRYESGGLEVPGSPVIAVNAAKEFALQHRHHSLVLVLIENNRDQVNLLKNHLTPFEPLPDNLEIRLIPEDSRSLVPDLLPPGSAVAPSFFMIDPYGHPL